MPCKIIKNTKNIKRLTEQLDNKFNELNRLNESYNNLAVIDDYEDRDFIRDLYNHNIELYTSKKQHDLKLQKYKPIVINRTFNPNEYQIFTKRQRDEFVKSLNESTESFPTIQPGIVAVTKVLSKIKTRYPYKFRYKFLTDETVPSGILIWFETKEIFSLEIAEYFDVLFRESGYFLTLPNKKYWNGVDDNMKYVLQVEPYAYSNPIVIDDNMYHYTYIENVPSIEKNGFMPKSDNTEYFYPNRCFYFIGAPKDKQEEQNIFNMLIGEDSVYYGEHLFSRIRDIVLFSFKKEDMEKFTFYRDVTMKSNMPFACYTYDTIPYSCVYEKIIYENVMFNTVPLK